MRLAFAVALAGLVCGCASSPPPEPARHLIVLYSAELHATLEPTEGLGGAARRAAVAAGLRASAPGPVLLLDGGAFAAGGPHDPQPQGRARDRERTLATARAMAATGYDAVAVGDEELASGLLDSLALLLPLVSANLPAFHGAAIPALRSVERDGVRVNILALTTQEPLLAATPRPDDPLRAAAAALQHAPAADWTILIAHLGEALAVDLARELPDIDLVLNAHRRRGGAPARWVGDVPLVQFDYRGRSLARIDLRRDAPPRVRGIELDAAHADDPRVAALVAGTRFRAQRRPPLDIYLSPGCSYCEQVGESLIELAPDPLSELELVPRIQAAEDGSFTPADRFLGCARSWLDELAWLELFLAVSRGEPLTECARRHELEACLEAGEESLEVDRERTLRLGIDKSPALFVANRLHRGALDPVTLEWLLCRALSDSSRACTQAPECLADRDCAAPGRLGICRDAGTRAARCVSEAAPRVNALVLYDSTAVAGPERELVAALRGLLPGLETRWIEHSSAAGRSWIEKLDLRYLPALVLDGQPAAPDSGIFVRRRSEWLLDPAVSGANLDLAREPIRGALDILVPPLDRFARGVLAEALQTLAFTQTEIDLRVRPLLPAAQDRSIDTLAECRRWLAVDSTDPAVWQRFLDGEAIAEPVPEAATIDARLADLERWLERLGVEREAIVFLAQNREIVEVRSGADLARLLLRIEETR